MNINFENLYLIKQISEDISFIKKQLQESSGDSKRWLNIKEVSNYLGYSKDHIHKLKASHLIEGKHFFKKAGRVLFDKYEMDNWVKSSNINLNPSQIANEVLKDLIGN